MIRSIVLACFFISGMSGLIYEVIWTRLLGLVFGNTVYANSTVLTAYMAGLALGSYISGRYSDNIKRTLRFYAFLEIGIGLYCLIIPFLINALGGLYYPVQQSLSPFGYSLIRFFLCFMVLLIPTTLMGATMPVFSRYYVEADDRFGHGIGRVYATNTFGAFLGTLLSGFIMIAYLGVRNTINIAFIGNIAAAAVCLLVDSRQKDIGQETRDTRRKTKDTRHRSRNSEASIASPKYSLQQIVLIAGFGVSGFSAMVYEVAWARALVMIIGSSVYAFSIMLATFLLGIGIGSFIFSAIAKRRSINMLWFAYAQLIIGFVAIIMLPVFQLMPMYFVNLFEMFVKNHNTLELLKFFFSALIMIVPTILLGSLFPMVTQICTTNYRELGKRVGTIYSINTLGNIIGSFLAGFILIPNMGIQNSIILGAYLNIAVGCAVLLSEANLRLAYRAIASITASALGITSILIIPSWDKMIISSGAAAYAPMYAKSKGEERKQNISGSGEELLYYKEGLNATITVKKRISGTIVMAVDGKVDASSTGDMYTQLLLAHLPLLLNPDAKSALVIGLGSGVTLSAAAQHELDRIDCVEIEPAVVEASKFFSDVNRDVLSDPRVNMIVNDGRNYLAGNKRRYDVIISEPSNLWLAGIANLFSSDFYKIAKSRLNPGGVLCQWSHIYYMSPDDMKVVINTFRSVFPHASIWFSTLGDILMIGTQEELRIDYLQLAKHYNISGVMDDLQRLSMREPLAILSCYLLDESGVARLTTNSRISSDNHPVLEFSVPRSIYENTSESNRKIIKGFQTRDFPEMDNFDEERVTKRASFWYHLGVAYDYKDMSEDAQRNYEKAISVDPVFTPAYEGLALSLYKEKEANKAIELLKKAIAIDPSGSEAYYNLGQIYFDQGLISDAVYNYKYAVELSPGNDKYKRKLSEALSKSQ